MPACEHAAVCGRPRPSPWAIHWRIVALIVFVMLLAEATAALFGISLVAGVTLVVPLVALGWLVAQSWRSAGRYASRLPASAASARRALPAAHPRHSQRGDRAGRLRLHGVALGSVLPASGLAPLVAELPSVTVPLLIPLLLIATGQLGLNPVAVVALIGAAVPDPGALGVPPAVLAFACMLGWGLGVTMTPMSSSAIITARWAGVSPWTVTTRWNALYTSSALLLAWAAIVLAFVMWPR